MPVSSNMGSRLPAGAERSRIGRPKSIRISTGLRGPGAQGQNQPRRTQPTNSTPNNVRTSVRMVRPERMIPEETGVVEHRVSPDRREYCSRMSVGGGDQPTVSAEQRYAGDQSRTSVTGRVTRTSSSARITTRSSRQSSSGHIERLASNNVPVHKPHEENIESLGRSSVGTGRINVDSHSAPRRVRRSSIVRPGSVRYPTKRESTVTPAGARKTEVRRVPIPSHAAPEKSSRGLSAGARDILESRRVSGGGNSRTGYSRARNQLRLPKSPPMQGSTPPLYSRPRFGSGKLRVTTSTSTHHLTSALPDRGAEEAVMSPVASAMGLRSASRRSTGARLSAYRASADNSANRSRDVTKESRYTSYEVTRDNLGTSRGDGGESKTRTSWKERLANASEILKKARRTSEHAQQLLSSHRSRPNIAIDDARSSHVVRDFGSGHQKESPETPSYTRSIDPQKLTPQREQYNPKETTPPTVRPSFINYDRKEPEVASAQRESLTGRASTSARRGSSRFADRKISLKNIDRLSLTIGRRKSRGTSMTQEDLLNAPTPVVNPVPGVRKLLDLSSKTPSPTSSSGSPEQEVLSVKRTQPRAVDVEPSRVKSKLDSGKSSEQNATRNGGKENIRRKLLSDDLSWIDQDLESGKLLTTTAGGRGPQNDLDDEDLGWSGSNARNQSFFSR